MERAKVNECEEALSNGISKLAQGDGLGALHYLKSALAYACSSNNSEQILQTSSPKSNATGKLLPVCQHPTFG